jgi:hypothetical protein
MLRSFGVFTLDFGRIRLNAEERATMPNTIAIIRLQDDGGAGETRR